MAKKTPELVEHAKALRALDWKNRRIANQLGVDEATIRRWLKEPDPPEIADALADLRLKKAQSYIHRAWNSIDGINDEVDRRIEAGELREEKLKDLAVMQAIYVDKINLLEAKRAPRQDSSPINILIVPPGGDSGHQTKTVADTVQVYDVEGEVLGDNLGPGSGEDVLRLPARCDDGSGVSGESRGNSSIDVQEPGGLHCPDAGTAALGGDGSPGGEVGGTSGGVRQTENGDTV